MTDKKVNWDLIFYVVGGCWLLSFVLYVVSEVYDFPFNPVPKVGAAILGVVVHGYIGAGDRYEVVIIFVYATLVGLAVSWLWQKSRKPAVIIGITATIHMVLSVMSLPLLILAGGR